MKKVVMCMSSNHPADGYVGIPGQLYLVRDFEESSNEYVLTQPGWEKCDDAFEPAENYREVSNRDEAFAALAEVFERYRIPIEKVFPNEPTAL